MPADASSTATLLDGTVITVRPLRTDDYDAVLRLASELNGEERYQRFFTIHPTYIGEWALSLTAPAEGIAALGAFDREELLGVANYAELPESGEAEIAVVVAHEQHKRGVGTLLLRALGVLAHRAGIHRFVADVLTENHAMRAVIKDAGWPVVQHCDRAVLAIEVNLDGIDQELVEPRSVQSRHDFA
jgi:RimJ/RimL family protein N-acetyltransferase